MLGKVDVAAAILEIAKNGISLSELQSRTNLQLSILEEQLELLRSKDLISINNDRKKGALVKTTRRGIQFLNLYDSISLKYLKVAA